MVWADISIVTEHIQNIIQTKIKHQPKQSIITINETDQFEKVVGDATKDGKLVSFMLNQHIFNKIYHFEFEAKKKQNRNINFPFNLCFWCYPKKIITKYIK